MPLNKRQKDFADFYIELGNAGEAAVRAGYKEKYARQSAHKLLQNATISDYINKRMAELDAERIADQAEVLRFYTSVLRGQQKDQFGLEASLDSRLKAADSLMKRFAAAGYGVGNRRQEDDPLTKALKEEAARMQSVDNGDQ